MGLKMKNKSAQADVLGKRNRTYQVSLLLWIVSGVVFCASAEMLCVWSGSSTPEAPYTNWQTAAHDIQTALDIAEPGDTVRVANGEYANGLVYVAGMPTRVCITSAVTVESVGGPLCTIIKGSGAQGTPAVRCVYLAEGATISGFTITEGTTENLWNESGRGGGVYAAGTNAVVTNCIITRNAAVSGGGVFRGTVLNCVIEENTARMGGAVFDSVLQDCILVDNTGRMGGDGFDCTFIRCRLMPGAEGASVDLENCRMEDCLVWSNPVIAVAQPTESLPVEMVEAVPKNEPDKPEGRVRTDIGDTPQKTYTVRTASDLDHVLKNYSERLQSESRPARHMRWDKQAMPTNRLSSGSIEAGVNKPMGRSVREQFQ
jgi:hypothetical protein